MTLDNLLRIGKLKPHAASKVEITRLLAAAERALADASVGTLSPTGRLDLACCAVWRKGPGTRTLPDSPQKIPRSPLEVRWGCDHAI